MGKAVIPCSPLIALANGAELLRQDIGIDLNLTKKDIGLTEGEFRINLLKSSRLVLEIFDDFTNIISKPMNETQVEDAQVIVQKITLQLAVINESLRCKLGDK